jgi:hypothetical protein
MKTINLRVPAPFNTGPQYNENGDLIPGSWPAGLPHEGIRGWIQLGMANGGLSLCEFIAADDWPIGDIPGGWRANASYIWDMVSQHWIDDQGVLHYAMTPELITDKAEYTLHIPAPVDDNNDPTGEPAVYGRLHMFQGWPLIDPIEVVTP